MKFGQSRIPNNKRNPDQILTELRVQINDAEILEEIEEMIDFSGRTRFVDSLKENYRRFSNISRPNFKGDSFLIDEILDMDHGEILSMATESIIMIFGRPALIIQNDRYQEPITKTWRKRFKNARIPECIPSVGRIEMRHHHTLDWCGTGWLLKGSEFIITNRHVANVFAEHNGEDFVFRPGELGKTMQSLIDFKAEHQIDEEAQFKVKRIMYIAEEKAPDIAVLKVYPENIEKTKFPEGLELDDQDMQSEDFVYTIGYPYHDPRILDSELRKRIFKDIYSVKRLAPGQIIGKHDEVLYHDCSTAGGNSGSPVINLNSGKVVGVHFAGAYRKENMAVHKDHLQQIIQTLK